MVVDQEKLKKLQAQAAAAKGGKGAPRRKPVKVGNASSAADDKKLSTALKKLNVQPITGVEECNMFMENGNVLHFSAPKVHAAVTSNTYAIYGHGQEKELTELVPGILNQLGPDSLASLRKMAESYNAGRAMAGGKEKEPEDDDDVPDLVESFEVDEKAGEAAPADSSASKLEELE
ncbi:NAC-domain-containing protein [Cystobasidium minutum MCA 4210]|uniref:NAC-domain-containing protein n=1 Tax=Cystobasidium minutum MCA 4210 TaxID=1397322 RepID=UPI0034CEDB35|eukprot:jgi/Rhomi1/172888/fgenesh1_kg.5_\